MQAEHADDITLWLLLAERTGFLSLAGESLMSSMLSSADSGLQQQVHLQHNSSLLIQFSLYTINLEY